MLWAVWGHLLPPFATWPYLWQPKMSSDVVRCPPWGHKTPSTLNGEALFPTLSLSNAVLSQESSCDLLANHAHRRASGQPWCVSSAGMVLDVSKSLKTKHANVRVLTRQLLQCHQPHGEPQPIPLLLHSQVLVYLECKWSCVPALPQGHSLLFLFEDAALSARITSAPAHWTTGSLTSLRFILCQTQRVL